MSTVDPETKCSKCDGYLYVAKVPMCNCGKKEKPTPCPKCENDHRVRIDDSKVGFNFFCGQCGFVERDVDSLPFQIAICHSCGRVPKARSKELYDSDNFGEGDVLIENTMLWTCCGITSPVIPHQVLFWCHAYVAQQENK